MTREAALLGVPTLSAFAGSRPAVDAWLERRGSLARLRSTDQVADVRPRAPGRPDLEALRDRARRIEDVFVAATIDLARARRGPG
jgi:predicted glycosyltransferase